MHTKYTNFCLFIIIICYLGSNLVRELRMACLKAEEGFTHTDIKQIFGRNLDTHSHCTQVRSFFDNKTAYVNEARAKI